MMEDKKMRSKSTFEHEDVSKRDCRKYKEKHGRHFNKALCKHVVDKMENRNKSNHHYSVDDVKHIWKNERLPDIEDANWYDVTVVTNMGYADYFGKLFTEDRECAIYAYLYLSDPDGYEGIAFSRWLTDCKRKHVQINWSKFIDEDTEDDDDYEDD